ncbi:hypothetical protein TKK_0008490 [Trichogramma kaykai]
MSRGRKPIVDNKLILSTIVEFEILDPTTFEPKPRSNQVWEDISAKLNKNVKPLNLFLMCKQNRHDLLNEYKKIINIETPNKEIEILEEEFNEETVSDEETDEVDKNKNEYEIELTSNQWQIISPLPAIDGEDETLQSGWTDLVSKVMWEKNKNISCVYNFNRHTINKKDYINIDGYCSVCPATFNITCYEKPNQGAGVNLFVELTGIKNIYHNKKRHLKGPERERVKEELRNQKPKSWRRDEIGKNMKFGDSEPPHLYSLSQLQQARREIKNQDLGINVKLNVFDSLEELKKNSDMAKFIRNIGFSPFHIMYWSQEQIKVGNGINQHLGNSFAMDATGSVVIELHQDVVIFLTVLSTCVDHSIVPVAQLLSEKNVTNLLNYFLNEYIKAGGQYPDEFCTDMGKALQNSISLAFNHLTYKNYLDECFLILKENKKTRLNTQMRIDVTYLQHAVSRWDCLKDASNKVKEVYLTCTGFMTTISNISDFEQFLSMVLTLAKCKFNDSNCQKSLEFITDRIQTFKFDPNSSKSIEEPNAPNKKNSPEDDNDNVKETTIINIYLNNLMEQIDKKTKSDKKSSFGQQDNNYHLPKLASCLINLCKEFPCWTNVMNKYFGNERIVATSARAETYFGEIKSTLLENRIPERVDKFLVKHCKQIDVDITSSNSTLENLKKKENQ